MDHHVGKLLNEIAIMGFEVVLNFNQTTEVYILNLIIGGKQLDCFAHKNLLDVVDNAHCRATDEYNRMAA
jgi:hypothetical protein